MEQNWLKTAIILTAGWGTRRLPITKTIEKNMLPVGNRPLIDFAVQDALSVGIEEIYIVVSSAERSQIRDYYSQNLELEQFLPYPTGCVYTLLSKATLGATVRRSHSCRPLRQVD